MHICMVAIFENTQIFFQLGTLIAKTVCREQNSVPRALGHSLIILLQFLTSLLLLTITL